MPGSTRLPLLGRRTVHAFLSGYWQKKPLLVRRAFPAWANPLTPEELAGLALERDVAARLVTHGKGGWTLRHGPFRRKDFTTLPPSGWTLLVQEVNRHIPEVARLIDGFRFIPAWRLDDVMVSYAAPGGSVGPHVDSYDVFLIQGFGKRRWQISRGHYGEADLIPGIDLQVIGNFVPHREWLLEPGDMLYLPPGVAHYGVAEGACMTYSVGFRAPAVSELLGRAFECAVERTDPAQRYSDADLTVQRDATRIGPEAIRRIRRLLKQQLLSDSAIASWFGRTVTEPRTEYLPDHPPDARKVARLLAAGTPLAHVPGSRWAHAGQGKTMRLFVNGQEFAVPPALSALVPRLCRQAYWPPALLAPYRSNRPLHRLLASLMTLGALSVEAP